MLMAVLVMLQRGTLLAALVPQVRLEADAQPMVEAGGLVRYWTGASNWGFGQASGLAVTHTLPEGFSYETGSTQVWLDGTVLSTEDPHVRGTALTWESVSMPAASGVFDNHYGVHTFVQDLCLESYVDFQLDKALDLVGVGGHVKQLLYPVTASTSGPDPCWVYFVQAAYDRTLVPIVRVQGEWGGDFWIKPAADGPGNYTSIAQAYKRVVAGLPRRAGHTLYVEIWNEPDVPLEWSGESNASEYGHFFVDVARAIHSIGDPRIKVLNGALTPGNMSFVRQLIGVPDFVPSFDLWASHCYPFNHPPDYNIHDGTARYPQYAIDCYLLELSALSTYGGRSGVKVILTETGYQLYDRTFYFEGYPAITEDNRAYYMERAFRDFWARWPEVVGATPFQLVDPYGSWSGWDWLYPGSDLPHKQYTVVKALTKPSPIRVYPTEMLITFAAQVTDVPGTYFSDVTATVDNGVVPPLERTAPVMVVDELYKRYLPLAGSDVHRLQAGLEAGLEMEQAPATGSLLDGIESWALEPEPAEPRSVHYLGSPQSPEGEMKILSRIQVGRGPQAMALDPSGDRVYVTLEEGVLVTLDTGSRRVLCRASVGRDPQGVAAHPSSGEVYVANRSDGTVSVVQDAGCGEVNTVAGLMSPNALVVDNLANRIFVSDSGGGQVVILDAERHQVVGRISVGSFPETLAVDPTSGLVYVANAGDGTLSVVERDTLQVVSSIDVAQGPLFGLAVDGTAGSAYVVHLGPAPRRQISVVDGRSGEVMVSLVGDREHHLSDLYAVAVDEERGRLYVAGGQDLLVVDTEGWSVFSATRVDAVTTARGSLWTRPGRGCICWTVCAGSW
jgi:YVTN family beta-propeller protein